MKKIKITNTDPERLDKILADKLDISRSKIQKAIKAGTILVDENEVPVKFLVTSENQIKYDPKFFKVEKTKIKKSDLKLDIIFEDDDVLVINKPAGLLVHQTETSTELTLCDALTSYNKKIKKVGDHEKRAGIVHRLDKFVSGVMITAKNQKAFEHLKDQFKNRRTTKKYSVLVHGNMEKPHDTINLAIERSRTTGRMAAKPNSQGGKSAITHYNVEKQYPHHALLDVTIETGRTNQIRAHMFAIGHPVVGDPLYKQRDQKLMNIDRLFLHARKLTTTLPNGDNKTFIAKIPEELKKVLNEIPKL